MSWKVRFQSRERKKGNSEGRKEGRQEEIGRVRVQEKEEESG